MKQPHRHADGPLTTRRLRKNTKERVRRWAKRVLRRVSEKQEKQDEMHG